MTNTPLWFQRQELAASRNIPIRVDVHREVCQNSDKEGNSSKPLVSGDTVTVKDSESPGVTATTLQFENIQEQLEVRDL